MSDPDDIRFKDMVEMRRLEPTKYYARHIQAQIVELCQKFGWSWFDILGDDNGASYLEGRQK